MAVPTRPMNIRVTPAAPPPSSFLSLSQLTWLGTFKSPSEIPNQGGAAQSPVFTVRRKAGVLRVFFTTPYGGGFAPPNELIEGDYPGYHATFGSQPQVTANKRNWGNGYIALLQTGDSARGGTAPRIGSSLLVMGLHWSPVQQCLYIVGGDVYNVSGYNDPVLVRGDIDDATNTISWSGPWRLSGTSPGLSATPRVHQTHSHIVDIPAAFGDAYAGGARIALGGNFWSGAASCSFGDTLWALSVTPTPATPTYLSAGAAADIPAVNLMGGDYTHRQTRQGDFRATEYGGIPDADPTSFSRTAMTGKWTSMDSSGSGSALWLNWADLDGPVFINTRGRGHCWYATSLNTPPYTCIHGVPDRYTVTGPESVVDPVLDVGQVYGVGPDLEGTITTYDPALLPVVVGARADLVTVAESVYIRDQWASIQVDDTEYAPNRSRFMALAADETSRLIFIPACGVPDFGANRFYAYAVNVFAVS